MARSTEASRNRRQPATERDLTHAAQFTRPPTACGRRNRDRSILRPTRPHAQMRKADCARKHVACKPARPTAHPSAPAIRVQKDQASDSTSNTGTATHPENVMGDTARPNDPPRDRRTRRTQRTHPRENAAKYSALCSSSRMILPHPSRPNAMLSRRRAATVVRANWWDGGRLEHLV